MSKTESKTSNSQLAILVSSSDGYEDAWLPYFSLLNANWQNCKYPVYLNTESKKFFGKVGTQQVQTINAPISKKKEAWSARLIRVLKTIPEPFILFSLEDFFSIDAIDYERIDNVLAYIQADSNIASFTLYPLDDEGVKESPEYPGFFLRKKTANYLANCQMAIWRKSIFLKLLRSYESPWEFESIGTLRAKKSPYSFYAQQGGKPMCVPYRLSPYHGYGIFNGKWLWNCKSLFERYGIKTDFSKRDTFESSEALDKYLAERKKQTETNEAYYSSFRCKLKSILPNFIVKWLRKIKKK